MRDERHYVIGAIRSFLDGSGGQWDWDGFTSASLRSAALDRLRRRAAAVALPLDGEGEATLRALLEEAEQLDACGTEKRKPWPIEAGVASGAALGAIIWALSFVQGGGIFQNLELIIGPAALGALVVALRNRREEVGYYDPENIEQNKQGRV
ncbi:MAG: hypothetical protein I8H86_06370 [Sphingomonadaceae bacterium]|nr:hypothetical protein [Sphingomonadaceae bacterium]